MQVDLFVGGVPQGQDFWGKEEDRAYIEGFYVKDDKQKFLVQIRTLNYKPYCCYNYLMYRDVIAYDSRGGSYIGLTLRFDAYCRDILTIYNILDLVYKKYILGSILKGEKGKLKYTVGQFENTSAVFKQMEDEIVTLINNKCSSSSFASLNGFPLLGANCPQIYLYDGYTNDDLDTLVRQYGGVAISPYYKSKQTATLEQTYETRLLSAKQQYEKELQWKKQEYEKIINDNNAALSMAMKTLQEQLQTIASGLEAEVKRLGRVRDVSDIVAKIEEPLKQIANPIVELATAMRSFEHGENNLEEEGDGGMVSKLRHRTQKFLPFVLVVISFILLLYIAYNIHGLRSSRISSSETKVEETESKITLSEEMAEQPDGSQASEEVAKSQPVPGVDDVAINIVEYSGKGNLRIGTTYTVEAKNGTSNGRWKVDGAHMENVPDNRIKITPDSTSVSIIYAIDGKEIKRRELRAQ
ncbi:MAG: hypothetical protein LUC44_08845 [Prevotellaceae bacterium]|nr:hypothetical protein [Prevotellaceae bacterium]